MEYENKYASKGVAGTGLGLGIAGTALGLMAGGLNGTGLFGGGCNNARGGCGDVGTALGIVAGLNGGWNNGHHNNGCGDGAYVNRYESTMAARIAELETEVKLRDSNIYTDGKILDLYKYVDGKFAAVDAAICAQNVYNATNTAAINCINGQVAQLMSLTKLVIPNGSVCPGWGAVTVTPATAPTTGA